MQSSIISVDQQLVDLEFLLITYYSKRVSGKVSVKLNANVKNTSINDVVDEKHYILQFNAPDIVKLRLMFFKNNKLARIPSECASSIIERFWPQVKVLLANF